MTTLLTKRRLEQAQSLLKYWAAGLYALSTFGVMVLFAFQSARAADGVPSPIGNNSMAAASPMTDYTIAAIAYVLVIGFLISVMMVGAFLILNLGLMSKRDRDRTGGRTPSDVGVLKTSNWPQVPEVVRVLPAVDPDDVEDELDEDTHPDEQRRPGAA